MVNKVLKVLQKPFIRNVIILTSGTAAAQIIGVAASPVITRLYGPEAYGIMGTFTSITSIVAPIAALTYPIAIVLPKSNKDAHRIMGLSFLISFLLTIIVGILILLFHDYIVGLLNIDDIAPYLYLIPLVVFSSGILQIIEQWLIRTSQFSINAKATFLQALVVNSGKIGLGFLNPIASILVLFSAFSQAVKVIFLLRISKVLKIIKHSLPLIWDKQELIKLAKLYKDFPIYRAPQTMVDSISISIPVLMLASFFGTVSVGFYSISRTVLKLPTQLISKSVGDVFYPKISQAFNNGQKISGHILKSTFILACVGIIPYGIIILLGPELFSFVFGSDWYYAGEYARWIALWSYTTFMIQPAVKSLPVISAQRFHLLFTIISLLIRLMMLSFGYFLYNNDVVAIAFFGASSGLMNIILIGITVVLSHRSNGHNRN